jgi:hypothetical protein
MASIFCINKVPRESSSIWYQSLEHGETSVYPIQPGHFARLCTSSSPAGLSHVNNCLCLDSSRFVRYQLYVPIMLLTFLDDPLTPQFLHRYMEADAVSDLAFQCVRRLVKTCDESHEVCHNIEKKKWYPSRLIQVEPNTSNNVKLVDCPDGQVAYIALSHCWGSSRTFETTGSNIQRHHEGIDIDEIPKTFRDAIIVGRQLNVRYLWIDSICIIQDSKHDWFVEASRMDDIYSNASLTISASCSKNDADGFLRNRPHNLP